jgi:hypothetical protein
VSGLFEQAWRMLKAKFTLLEGNAGRLALVSGEVRLSEAQHSSSSIFVAFGRRADL